MDEQLIISFKFTSIHREKTKAQKATETLLAYLQEALADHGFVVDYQRLFPIQDDMDIVKQACPELYV